MSRRSSTDRLTSPVPPVVFTTASSSHTTPEPGEMSQLGRARSNAGNRSRRGSAFVPAPPGHSAGLTELDALAQAPAAHQRLRRVSIGGASVSDAASPSPDSPRVGLRERILSDMLFSAAGSQYGGRRSSVATSLAGSAITTGAPLDDSKLHFAELSRGDSYLLPEDIGRVRVGCSWDHVTKKLVDVDASAVLFAKDGRKIDHVSFGRRVSRDKAVVHMGDERGQDRSGDDEAIRINFAELSDEVAFVTVLLNVYTTGRTLDDVRNVSARMLDLDPSRRYAPGSSITQSPSSAKIASPASGGHSASAHSPHDSPPPNLGEPSAMASVRHPPGGARAHSTRGRPAGSVRAAAFGASMSPRAQLLRTGTSAGSPSSAGAALPVSQAHEFLKVPVEPDRPKLTGAVVLFVERLTATDAGRDLRERVAGFMRQVEDVKSEAARVRELARQQRAEIEKRSAEALQPSPRAAAVASSPPSFTGHSDSPRHGSGLMGDSLTTAPNPASPRAADDGAGALADMHTLPGWRVIAGPAPVAGKTHRHVTTEASDMVNQIAVARSQVAFLPPEAECEVYGFRHQMLLSAEDSLDMLRQRRDAIEAQRAALRGDGPDLAKVGVALDDATFVDQFSAEMRRRRRLARGKKVGKKRRGSDASTGAGSDSFDTSSSADEAERQLDTQFRYFRGQRSTRPRMVRQARRIYSVGRAARPMADQQYFLDSDSTDDGSFYEDLFPNFRSRHVVRYDRRCYNVGSSKAQLYDHYHQHKTAYATTAREAVQRAAAAEEAAWQVTVDAGMADGDSEEDEFTTSAEGGTTGDEGPAGSRRVSGLDGAATSAEDGGADPSGGSSPRDVDAAAKSQERSARRRALVPPPPTFATVVAPRLEAQRKEEEAAAAERARLEAEERKKNRGRGRRKSVPRGGPRPAVPRASGSRSTSKPSPPRASAASRAAGAGRKPRKSVSSGGGVAALAAKLHQAKTPASSRSPASRSPATRSRRASHFSVGEDAMPPTSGPPPALDPRRRRSLTESSDGRRRRVSEFDEWDVDDDSGAGSAASGEGGKRGRKFKRTWDYSPRQERGAKVPPTQAQRPPQEVFQDAAFQHSAEERRKRRQAPRMSVFDDDMRRWVADYLSREAEKRRIPRRTKAGPTSPTGRSPDEAALLLSGRFAKQPVFARMPTLSDTCVVPYEAEGLSSPTASEPASSPTKGSPRGAASDQAPSPLKEASASSPPFSPSAGTAAHASPQASASTAAAASPKQGTAATSASPTSPNAAPGAQLPQTAARHLPTSPTSKPPAQRSRPSTAGGPKSALSKSTMAKLEAARLAAQQQDANPSVVFDDPELNARAAAARQQNLQATEQLHGLVRSTKNSELLGHSRMGGRPGSATASPASPRAGDRAVLATRPTSGNSTTPSTRAHGAPPLSPRQGSIAGQREPAPPPLVAPKRLASAPPKRPTGVGASAYGASPSSMPPVRTGSASGSLSGSRPASGGRPPQAPPQRPFSAAVSQRSNPLLASVSRRPSASGSRSIATAESTRTAAPPR